ncbi:hypothetical protein SNE40_011108 [Patella caerulea]|uniref:Integrase core domain-containing protein n=1 Tax=Patella caerulea TaxID=87958 RepID=A0AAN8JZS9_PATCE
MLLLLYLHQVNISLSTLKRRLSSLRLKRKLTGSRNTISSYNDVVNAIITEIGCSGRCIGHLSMWYRLKIEWGIRFPRDEIIRLMRIVDPEGIRVRKRRRLHRRRYICKGANAVWHVDGYDKIKPFGFCIHGCVDGFSRRIIWLRVGKTNNNPKVIARYYLEAVQQLEVVPAKIRCDLGTENSILKNLQPLFHYDENDPTACLKSFIYGKSTSNQRIEAWWSILRRQCLHWWIN